MGLFLFCFGPFFVLIWIWPSMVQYEWDWASSFLLCLWFIAEQLLCSKTYQRHYKSGPLYPEDTCPCAQESWSQAKPLEGLENQVMCQGRGHLAQEGQLIRYRRVHENEEDAFIIIWEGAVMIIISSVPFMAGSKCSSPICHLHRNRGQCEVRGHHLSLGCLWEQCELSQHLFKFIFQLPLQFQLLNPCCV